MEDGSKTQSLKNSLSLANAHQFKQSCGYSRSLSSFGDSFTSGLNDTFGAGFSDKLGGLAGNVASRVAGDYVSKKVSKKIGGPFGNLLGDTIGGAVGSTLGNTVSGAFSSSDVRTPGINSSESSNANAGTGIDMNQGMGGSQGSKVKTPRASKALASQTQSSWSNPNTQGSRPTLGSQSSQPSPSRLTQPKVDKDVLMGPLGPVINPMTGKPVKIKAPAQTPKPAANSQALKTLIADVKAKRQQGTATFNRPTGNSSPDNFWKTDGTTPQGRKRDLLQRGTAKLPTLSDEADASNARLAAASARTSDHTALKRDVTSALKTGGVQAQAEVHDLTQKMDKLRPGSGTKLAREVGLNPDMSGGKGQTVLRGGSGEDTLKESQTTPPMPPRKPDIVASPPPDLDEANKLLNGEPRMFRLNDGTVRQVHPPQFESPTKSGIVRKPDGQARQGGPWGVNRTKNGKNYDHRGIDFNAKEGDDIKSSVTGVVKSVKSSPYENSTLRIVDIETSDGYVVRHFYVSPSLNVGDKVTAGKTSIGTSQNVAKDNPGMTNHVHVEIRDPRIKVYDKSGLRGAKDINPKYNFKGK